MTNGQREAIDNLSEIVKLSKEELQKENENITAILDYKDLKSLDTNLALIKEQQDKIAKYEKIYKEYDCYRWVKELDKKDKQIDLMAELVYKRFKAELLLEYGFENEDQLKQYFAGLVEKE